MAVSPAASAKISIQNLAPRPPLGFNSFDSYLTYLSEDKAYALMDVMAEKYRPFGYEYFVIDAGWARNVELYPGSMYPKKSKGVAMIDMTKPGAQAYYNALIDKLAGWNIDFIKADDIVPNPQEMVAVAKAIEDGGHTMIYSLSPGDVHYPTHLTYYRRANMLRITADIWDNPLSIEKGFIAWEKFQGTERAGFWPDLDMIPFGRLTVIATSDIPDVPPDRRARQSQGEFTW